MTLAQSIVDLSVISFSGWMLFVTWKPRSTFNRDICRPKTEPSS